jgi:hypothetical protein
MNAFILHSLYKAAMRPVVLGVFVGGLVGVFCRCFHVGNAIASRLAIGLDFSIFDV